MVRQDDKYAWTGNNGKAAAPASLKSAKLSSESDDAVPCVAFVDSELFDISVAMFVLVNIVLLSVETDTNGSVDIWKRINEGFLLLYLLELVTRFLRHGARALTDPLMVMDLIVVVMAFIDRIASERSLARALPVLRLARVFRLLRRMPYFQDSQNLNALLANSYKASGTLLWVVLILFAVLWSSATWTTEVLGESAAWNGSMDPLIEHEPYSSFDNHEYFGSVPRSMLTHLQLLTLSQWADNVARPVIKVYPATFLFFDGFLFATTYGLLLCIVSIIVQDTIVASRRVAFRQQEMERDQRRITGMQAIKIFALVDENGDGELSTTELHEALQTTDLEKILKELQVPVLDAESLVRLFDRDGDGYVNQEEFVTGIISMDEDIQPRDFVKLHIWVWNLMMRSRQLQAKLDLLQQQVVKLGQKLEIGFTAMTGFMNTHEDTNLRHRAIKAIRSAPPELPLTAEQSVPPSEIDDDASGGAEIFAKLQMPFTPAWAREAAIAQQRRVKTLWKTVASPFVTIRDRPHITGNHIGACRPGEVLEFEDLEEGPVRPEHLREYPYLRCWKLDAKGKRGIPGFVVGYSPIHGDHFVPSADASARNVLPEANDVPATDDLMAPVTVVTPPRLPSPRGQDRILATLVNRKAVLPPAPDPLHVAKQEAEVVEKTEDKYGLRADFKNPNLSQLKDLIA